MIDLGWLGQIAFTWEFFAAVMSIVLIARRYAAASASQPVGEMRSPGEGEAA